MKKKKGYLGLLSAVCVCLCMTACGSDRTSGSEGAGIETAEYDNAVDEGDAQDEAVSSEEAVQENDDSKMPDDWADGSSTAEDVGTTITDGIYSYGDMTVTIPESWIDRVNVKEVGDGFYFVQKASVEKDPTCGYMCGFYRSKDIVYNFAGERPLACADDTIYYVQEPTDAPFYNDPEIMNEYGSLMSKLSQVEGSLRIDNINAVYSKGEYMLFGSDIAEISEDILINLDLYELWIARNEIFARHGRMFSNYYLQGYFNTCSWYHGVTEGEKFDESVLNETEKKNVEQIKAMEAVKKAEKPYPVRYRADQTAQEDLDGDGQKEKVRIAFRELEYGYEPQPILAIDGTEYHLADMGLYFECANTDDFYITDIWSWEAGLEIAVMDYGPSDDLVTHFFRYDGQLSYVGAVGGFPFKDYLGFDGFYMDGVICSEMRADLISSAYAYGTWWADSTSHELFMQDGVFKMEYDGLHTLLVDLPMYAYMDGEADLFVMKAGQEVCFTETDAKEWIGLKDMADGTVGYIRYMDRMVEPIGLEPDRVFSDLKYFD